MADRPGPWIELKAGGVLNCVTGEVSRACQTPPEPQGRVVAHTVKIDVSEVLDLDTGFAREGWTQFMWLCGWRARVAVFVLRTLNGKWDVR
jgi:hypothetical protein